jgi:hypothetical protein
MERAAPLAGAREERMARSYPVLLLALAVLVGGTLLCGVLPRMDPSAYRRPARGAGTWRAYQLRPDACSTSRAPCLQGCFGLHLR